MLKLKNEYVECECGMELLQLSYDYSDENGGNNALHISFYSHGQYNSTSISTKLCHIWKVIRTGTPWEDQVMLNNEEIEKLKVFINSLSDLK